MEDIVPHLEKMERFGVKEGDLERLKAIVEFLESEVDKNPELAELLGRAYVVLAIYELQQKNFDAAAEYAEKATKILEAFKEKPDRHAFQALNAARRVLYSISIEKEDIDKASQILEEIAKEFEGKEDRRYISNHALAMATMADLMLKMGKKVEALTAARQALEKLNSGRHRRTVTERADEAMYNAVRSLITIIKIFKEMKEDPLEAELRLAEALRDLYDADAEGRFVNTEEVEEAYTYLKDLARRRERGFFQKPLVQALILLAEKVEPTKALRYLNRAVLLARGRKYIDLLGIAMADLAILKAKGGNQNILELEDALRLLELKQEHVFRYERMAKVYLTLGDISEGNKAYEYRKEGNRVCYKYVKDYRPHYRIVNVMLEIVKRLVKYELEQGREEEAEHRIGRVIDALRKTPREEEAYRLYDLLEEA